MKNWFNKIINTGICFIFLAFPASTNYKLGDYNFGGGGNSGNSTNYSMMSQLGQAIVNNKSTSPNYSINAGLIFEHQANVPSLSVFENPSNFYNKLRFVINTQNNSTDTTYALAISSNDFVTTYYVKSDMTIGTSLSLINYQTYTAWGGASGNYVIGLDPSTTYKMKVSAMKGKFSESGWGPVITAATVDPQITFDIDVATTDIESAPPYSIDLGDLIPSTVVTSTSKIWVDIDTNANNGGSVFVYGKNNGLLSTNTAYTINSLSGNLDVATTGFGGQGSSVTQLSGGPLLIDAPYNGASNTVGVVDTSVRSIFSTVAPITSGRGSFVVKAKAANDSPAASDYTDMFTVVAATNF